MRGLLYTWYFALFITVFSVNAGCTVKTVHNGGKNEEVLGVGGLGEKNKAKAAEVEASKTPKASTTVTSDSTDGIPPPPVAERDETQLGTTFTAKELEAYCLKKTAQFPGKYDKKLLANVCKDVQILDSCVSRNGQPIYHYDRPSIKKNAERILTFAVTHGDELASGSVARSWANRLSRINPRNEWRIVPILNPDGFDAKTRMNAAGVDINRNYPSKDWDELALKWWKSKKKSDPRRYPGPTAGSEPETQCSIDHIKDFQPDLIISVHTPLGVLDFDGPRLNFPSFSNLPWISLGTYPGSLGRFMWHDQHVPVLTIELKHNVRQALDKFDRLQDISGQVALTISKDEKKKRSPKTKK